MDIEKKILSHFDFDTQLQPFEENPHIAIAVSGGGDSMALALLASGWINDNGGNITALTVNHGLRKEAANEAIQVTKWLKTHDIAHKILTYSGDIPKSNIQEQARDIRYDLMTDWCKDNNILHLLVAHNMEDQAETFLIRLQRGSGVDGLSAMSPISWKNNVRILRPLLKISHDDLLDYLQAKNQEWIEDPSNKKNSYLRNRVRAFLANETDNKATIKRLCNTAENMSRAKAALETETTGNMVDIVHISPLGYGTISHSKFTKISEEIALRIISSLITTISGEDTKPRFEKLQNLYSAIKHNHDIKGLTLSGCKIYSKAGDLIITRELEKTESDVLLSQNNQNIIWDNRFSIDYAINSDDEIYIGKVDNDGWNQIKDSVDTNLIPKEVILSLPCLKINNTQTIENIIYVPYIEYNADKLRNILVKCIFCPSKPLATISSGCYVRG